jgi:cytochrome c peroxidase
MHDGRFRTLDDVVAFYDSGIHADPNLDPRLRAPAYFGASRSPVSVHVDQSFRSMSITGFGRSRSPVSVDVDQ